MPHDMGREKERAAENVGPPERRLNVPRVVLFSVLAAVLVAAVIIVPKWWFVWVQNVGSLFTPDAPEEFLIPTPTPQPKPTPTPEPARAAAPASPTPEPTPSYYNDDWNYQDENITVSLMPYDVNGVQYFVADIKLTDISYLFTTFANDKLGNEHEVATSNAARYGAVLAVTGDYCGFDDNDVIIRNGILCRDKPSGGDMLLIYSDGRMEVIDAAGASGEQLIQDGVLQTFTFGPWLVKDGELRTDWTGQRLKKKNPRCAVGMLEPLHYVFVVVDGRSKYSSGMTLDELAQLMQSLGCVTAYNLDGGGTATMVFRDRLVNRPLGKSAERSISDFLLIGPVTDTGRIQPSTATDAQITVQTAPPAAQTASEQTPEQTASEQTPEQTPEQVPEQTPKQTAQKQPASEQSASEQTAPEADAESGGEEAAAQPAAQTQAAQTQVASEQQLEADDHPEQDVSGEDAAAEQTRKVAKARSRPHSHSENISPPPFKAYRKMPTARGF